MDLSVYLNDICSIKKNLTLINEETSLNNYLEQLKCAKKSEFLNSEFYAKLVENKYNLSMNEIEQKFRLKLNQSINGSLEKINNLIVAIESHLNSMTRQHELAFDSKQTKLLDSMQKINKVFWKSFYQIKNELKYENLVKTLDSHKLNELASKWLRVELLHLQTEIEICRCLSTK